MRNCMKTEKYCFLLFIILLVSCGQEKPENVAANREDKTKLSNETGIESFIIEKFEEKTGQKSKKLTTYFSPLIHSDDSHYPQDFPNEKCVKIPGVYVEIESKEKAVEIIESMRVMVQKKNCEIFISEENFGHGKDKLAIARNRDKWDIIKWQQTNGINYEITNDSVISILKKLDKKLDLEYIGADFDWCEFRIKKNQKDWLSLAKEIYKVCPDVVDQGTETVEAAAQELERNRKLYFWWD